MVNLWRLSLLINYMVNLDGDVSVCFFGGYLHWRNYLRATRKLGFLEINPLNCTPWPAKTGRDTGKSGATTWPVASCSASHACCWCYLFDNFLIYFDIRILVSEIVCFHAWPVNISSHHPLLKQIPFDAMLFPSLFDRLIDLVFLCDLGEILVIKKTNGAAFTLGKGAFPWSNEVTQSGLFGKQTPHQDGTLILVQHGHLLRHLLIISLWPWWSF